MSASSPPSTFSTSASTLASPHSTRCSPQIHRSPGLLIGFGRRLRRIIGIAIRVGLDDKQPVELVLIETGQRQIESGGLQIAEFKPEQFLAPLTRFCQLVVAIA